MNDIDDVLYAADMMSDKGYQLSTHEKQQEFARKRNEGKTLIRKIYLDMDGVLADFSKEYRAMWNSFTFDREQFRESVMQRKIFERLDKMSDADVLLGYVAKLPVEIEILTSMGTHRTDQGNAAKEQKNNWLRKHGIVYKSNFVRNKPEKAEYAESDTLLIDDSVGCIEPFRAAGGHAILHTDAVSTIAQLKMLGLTQQ